MSILSTPLLSPCLYFFFLLPPPPPTSTLFPYTTLFRSLRHDDYLTTTHRGHGDMIAKGARLDRMMAEPRTLGDRSEEHTSELQSHVNLVCRLLLEKKKKKDKDNINSYNKKHKVGHIEIN